MKLFALFCCVGLAYSGLVRRDADAEADAEADAKAEAEANADADADADAGHYGYGGVVRGAVSAPVCEAVPVKTCVPRQIETPRKVCHQEFDEILDTTITENCEEVITTTCQQTTRSSNVIGLESKIVATGVDATPDVIVAHGISAHGGTVAVPIGHSAVVSHRAVGHGYGKREANAEPEAEADADANPDADANYGLGYGAAPTTQVSVSVCNSVPVKECKNDTVSVPRKVAKTVCAVNVDVTTVEDCKEVITTLCSRKSQKVVHSSSVVGQETKVGPETVVATHGNSAVAIAAPVVTGIGHGLSGHAVTGLVGAEHGGVYHG